MIDFLPLSNLKGSYLLFNTFLFHEYLAHFGHLAYPAIGSILIP